MGQIPDAKGIQVTAIVWGLRVREMFLEELTCVELVVVCMVDNDKRAARI